MCLRRLWAHARGPLASGAAWLVVEALAARGLLIVAMFFTARILGVDGFGQLAAVHGTIILLSGLVSDALRLTVTRQVAAAAATAADRARSAIGVFGMTSILAAVALAAVLWMLAPVVAVAVLNDATLAVPLQTGAWVLVLESAGAILSAVLLGLKDFRSLAIGGIAQGVPLVPCVITGAMQGGVTGALWGLVAALGVSALVKLWLVARTTRRHGLAPTFDWRQTDPRVLWRLSLPAFLTGLSWAPINWLGIVMLVNLPGGYAEMGRLGVALQWFAALLFLPNIVGVAALPSLSAASIRRDGVSLARTATAGIRINVALSLPTAILVALAGRQILAFYGPDYVTGWSTLTLIAAAAVAASTLTLMNNLLAAIDRMWQLLSVQLVYGTLFLATALILLPRGWGADAIAAGMLLGYAAKLVLVLWLTRRTLRYAAPAAVSSETRA